MPSNKMLINTDQLIDILSICQCKSIRALPEGWNLSQLSLFRGLFLDRLSLHNRVDMGATSKPHTYNFESSWPNPARLFLTLPCGWIASDLKCEISFLGLHSNSGASGGNATLLTAAVSCEGKGHCYSTWHNYIPRERPFLSMSSSPNQMLPFFFFLSRFNIFAIFACFLFILVAASSPFTFESRSAVRAEMSLASQGS